ncbi:hypothetical protein [Amorphus sp. 3PC139-8]|uniref:hypothetical protein n=1 Tax=Amorphus sp. 3PC139-8 TaxID=2735676 RepID=UPI00345D44AD
MAHGTTDIASPAESGLFPPLTAATLITAILGGIAADLVWEIWARGITPFLVGGPLQPAALVQGVFGFSNWALAELIHAVVGIVAYPLGYLFIARPLQRTIVPGLPWWLTALGYGIGLWIFALYIMAHLFAGQPPFLGFIALTWASLAGHLLFALTLGAVVVSRRA